MLLLLESMVLFPGPGVWDTVVIWGERGGKGMGGGGRLGAEIKAGGWDWGWGLEAEEAWVRDSSNWILFAFDGVPEDFRFSTESLFGPSGNEEEEDEEDGATGGGLDLVTGVDEKAVRTTEATVEADLVLLESSKSLSSMEQQVIDRWTVIPVDFPLFMNV